MGADAGQPPPRDDRDRGQALLRAWRGRLRGHRARRDQGPAQRPGAPGRLDDHSAAGARALHPGPQARPDSQDPRGQDGLGARASAHQDLDPVAVHERRPLRDRQRPHGARRRGRRRDLLLQARQGPLAAGGRDARRHAAGALAVQPVPESDGGPRAAQRGAPGDGLEPLHHRGSGDSGLHGAAQAARLGSFYTSRREPYFFDYVQEQLVERYGADLVRQGGLRVYTTVDPKMQEEARQAIAGQLNQPGDPSSAIVSIDPDDRLHPRDGLLGQLRQGHLQPRRAGTPPARLLVQDVRADDRRDEGRQPRHDLLHVDAAVAAAARLRHLERQDLRGHLQRHDQPDSGDAAVRQHRLRAARRRPRPQGGRPDRQDDGHHDAPRRRPRRGSRGSPARGLAARDGRRVRDARLRAGSTRPPRRSRAWSFRAARPTTSAARSASACSRTASPTRSPRSSSRTSRRAPASRRAMAVRRPARRGRPTTTTTPGSSATPRRSPRRSGWATRTRWSRCATCTASRFREAASRPRSGTTT